MITFSLYRYNSVTHVIYFENQKLFPLPRLLHFFSREKNIASTYPKLVGYKCQYGRAARSGGCHVGDAGITMFVTNAAVNLHIQIRGYRVRPSCGSALNTGSLHRRPEMQPADRCIICTCCLCCGRTWIDTGWRPMDGRADGRRGGKGTNERTDERYLRPSSRVRCEGGTIIVKRYRDSINGRSAPPPVPLMTVWLTMVVIVPRLHYGGGGGRNNAISRRVSRPT